MIISTTDVICDSCCEDYTHSSQCGGILHRNSWAVCPNCEPKFTTYITKKAKPNQSFREFVQEVRRNHGWFTIGG